jgi:hypothetical protein
MRGRSPSWFDVVVAGIVTAVGKNAHNLFRLAGLLLLSAAVVDFASLRAVKLILQEG